MDNIYHCGRSVGTHLESKKSKCDYVIGHDLTPDERKQIEDTVNSVIAQNLEVKIYFVPPEQAPEMADVSKLPEEARNKDIRIVQIGEYDYCACIGLHVARTADIKGKFKITTTTMVENGICRMRWVCK